MNDLLNLKEFRKKMGLTQTQLANECGVTIRTVQNWENGGVIPEVARKLILQIKGNPEMVSSAVMISTLAARAKAIPKDWPNSAKKEASPAALCRNRRWTASGFPPPGFASCWSKATCKLPTGFWAIPIFCPVWWQKASSWEELWAIPQQI